MKKRVAKKILKNKDSLNYSAQQIGKAERKLEKKIQNPFEKGERCLENIEAQKYVDKERDSWNG